MTDAAIADSAPAPEAPVGAVINEHAPAHNSPLGSQIPPDARAENQPKAEPKSIGASIDSAFERSAAAEAAKAKTDPKVDAKAPIAKDAKPEPAKEIARGEGGKFAPKEPAADARAADQAQPVVAKPAEAIKPSHTAEEAPARFTETAKAKWAAADPEIRGETLRMQKELTDGYQKHRAAAERDASLNEFHEMATKSGTDVKTALSKYTALESLLRQDPIKGLNEVCNNMGLSLRDVAAHIMGQTPEQNASQSDATIRELKHELATLKEQVGGVTQTFKQQQEQSTLTEINKFAADHPRFDELANDIAFFMQSGRAKDLPEAYELAERLNPAASGSAHEPVASSAALAPAPSAQPDKGQKSINGAPSSGSTLPSGKKRPALSIDESLSRAFGRAG